MYYPKHFRNRRISLCVLPFIKKEDSFPIHFPISLFSIATSLEQIGIPTEIIDFQILIKKKAIILDKHFFKNAVNVISNKKPDIVGFTSNCVQYPIVLNLAKKYKEKHPKTIIVLGGPQASVTHKETLETFPYIDIIVRGDGEITIIELIKHILNNISLSDIKGISWRDAHRKIHINSDREPIKNLDKVPFPNYEIEPTIQPYLAYGKTFPIEAGRGCPYTCKFCHYSNPLSNNLFRMRSANNIVNHIKFLNRKYGLKNFIIEHDNFTSSKKRLYKFCNLILKLNKNIKWYCDSRVNTLNPKAIKLMAQAGCQSIFLGIETASERMQSIIGKKIDLKQIWSVIDECHKYGIKCRVAFMIGFPEEGPEDLNKTLGAMLTLRLKYTEDDFVFNIVHPHSGSIYYNTYKKTLKRVKYDAFLSHLKYNYLPAKIYKYFSNNVAKHSNIFSYFYYFENCNYPICFYITTQEYYSLILQFYPLTFSLLCKFINSNTLDLFIDFANILVYNTKKRDRDYIKYFINSFKDFINIYLQKLDIANSKILYKQFENENIRNKKYSRMTRVEYCSKGFFT